MSVSIPLTEDLCAVVDDVDADLASAKWYVARHPSVVYAIRDLYREDGTRTTQNLHQAVAARMGIDGLVDHKDRNGLNNTRMNLRPATVSQNGANRGRQRNNTSGVKGVSWNRRDGKWQAKVQVGGRAIAVGTFDDLGKAEEAVRAARVKLFGEYACHG